MADLFADVPAERAILGVFATHQLREWQVMPCDLVYHALANDGIPQAQAATAFRNMAAKGWISDAPAEMVRLTDHGFSHLRAVSPPSAYPAAPAEVLVSFA